MSPIEEQVVMELQDEVQGKLEKKTTFLQAITGILGILGKGKLLEFLSTKVVVLLKEIYDVSRELKEIREELKSLRAGK